MKVKVSDYIADYLADHGIEHVFTVVGGGAMHMNDSLGHHSRLKCIYNHHEQASSMAAEAYARIDNKMAAVCVTSGPGAINALNGVVGAYQDSIPMIVLSGQTKTSLLSKNSGLNIRTLGNQEFEIVSALGNATKYAETVMSPLDIKRCLDKAFYIAREGRPGPCWLDVPIDIQGAYIEESILESWNSSNYESLCDSEQSVLEKVDTLFRKLAEAKRPIIYAGNGIRLSGAISKLCEIVNKLHIPVVTCWDSIDLIETENPYYAGRAGIMGDRTGNFAVQNSDLIIAIGNRLCVYQVGYQIELWAREAYVVDVDVDPVELVKPTIRVDLPICYDASEFLDILAEVYELQRKALDTNTIDVWVKQCNFWKKRYPVVQEKHRHQATLVNIYDFLDQFSEYLPKKSVTVVANGAASVVGSATYRIKKNTRFIMNCALSSMGYDLPAAIGACVACGQRKVYCIAGDGSIQMNIQELQTIVTNELPIKIVVINNQGYHQIRLTQNNVFGGNHVGIGPQSEDLGFPNFNKLADAYGIPYYALNVIDDMMDVLKEFDNTEKYALLEVFCDTEQVFEPKSATKRREDGTLYSPPLEDMMPFLDRDELKENMFVEMFEG